MSREDGFAVADVSTGLLDDPKVRDLWRALGDGGRMGHALTLYTATVLASWRNGCRVTVDEAAPIWLEPDGELVAALQAVRLLDRARKLPARSWTGWFGPAYARREARREAGRKGGQVSRKPSDKPRVSNAQASLNPTGPTGPVRTYRSDRTDLSRAGARETAPSNNGATGDAAAAAREVVAALRLSKP